MTVPSAEEPKITTSLRNDCAVNLVYLAGQSGRGPNVLFLHANGFHIKCLAPLARCLEEHAFCIGVELRGQGPTPAPDPAEHLVKSYIQDVAAILQVLQFQGCYCFGHSGGGQLALALEAQQPGTFAAIYAYEPVLPSGPPRLEAASYYTALRDGALRRKAKFGSKQEVVKRYRSRPPFKAFQADAWQAYMDNNFTENADGSCVLTCSPANEARWFLDAGSYSNSKVWDEVPQVRCPVRLAVGGQKGTMDYLVAGAVAQLQRFPNATLKRYESLGHLGPLEDPTAVAADASAFFDTCHNTKKIVKAKL